MQPFNFSVLHFDLLTVGIAAAAIGLIGFLVYLNNRSSITNLSFLLFAILTILWNFTNFFQYQFTDAAVTLLALRTNLFVAVWHSVSFFQLCLVFPNDTYALPRWYTRAVIPLAIATALLTLTPLVFSGIPHLAPLGEVTNPTRGPGIILFSIVTLGLLLWGLWKLAERIATQRGPERRQTVFVFFGMFVTALLIVSFSVLLPIFFNKLTFLPLSAVFMFPFIALVSYSIYRFSLFNLKVFGVGVLVFFLAGLMFMEIIFTEGTTLLFSRVVLLVLVVVAGALLTRSVTREVEQRELIQRQELELEEANKRQENLLHFMSHEVKGYLAKAGAVFAMVSEGDYGAVSPELKHLVEVALADNRRGVDTVMDILSAGNLKKGTMALTMRPFDLRPVVEDVVRGHLEEAKEKGLSLALTMDTADYTVTGDAEHLGKHVIRNLVDNAVKYTPKGSVQVSLTRLGNTVRLSVKDSGVGITEEDMRRLFTEGGRGKDSLKVNAHSTGYGLFIAKTIVDAHHGSIRAQSSGKDKGSEFIVELPVSALKAIPTSAPAALASASTGIPAQAAGRIAR